MDKSQKKNIIKNKEKKKLDININNANNLFPHKTKLNNLKSKKYFSITTTNSDTMKKALIKYREENLPNKSQNEGTNSSTSTSTCNISKVNKINFQLDKNSIIFHEPKTKTSFQKIPPKTLEFNLNDKINNDDIDEFKIFNKKKINLSNINKAIEQNHKKYISEIKEPTNINIDLIIDDEDSIDFDINLEKDNEFNLFNNNLTDRNKNKLNISINLQDINFIECVKIENLFNELIKDLEINKMDKFEIKLNIVKKFLSIFNDNKNYNLFLTFDLNSLNSSINKKYLINKDQNIFLLIKEYLIQQLVFFYIIILIGLIKNEKEKKIYLSGLQNLSFYFHQNFQVFNFILTSKVNKNNINLLSSENAENYAKCINMVKENKTWLNQNNYCKCLKINNKMSKQVINNLFEQIRMYFNSNPYFDNNNIYKTKNNIKLNDNNKKFITINNKPNNKMNTINSSKSLSRNKNKNKNIINTKNNNKNTININNKNKNTIDENNSSNLQKDFIDSDINFLLEYIKSYKNVKFTNLLKDLKYSPSINYLKDKAKISESNISKKKPTTNKNSNLQISLEKLDEEKPKVPFLKRINPKYIYTLVLDLDETLIHYITIENIEYIQIRPGAEDFIKELSEFYEIVIFTASVKCYADLVIKGIDVENKVSAKLYREHTMKIGSSNIKDLDKLGRDLQKVIIVDNSPDNYNLQPKNGINVIDFDGNENDDILYYLKKDLIKLAKLEPEDVRCYLKDIQINMNKRASEIINMSRKINTILGYNYKNGRNKMKTNKKSKSVINDKIIESINEYDSEKITKLDKLNV